jgi:hypothetical protein
LQAFHCCTLLHLSLRKEIQNEKKDNTSVDIKYDLY